MIFNDHIAKNVEAILRPIVAIQMLQFEPEVARVVHR